jgi:hypothetical protein
VATRLAVARPSVAMALTAEWANNCDGGAVKSGNAVCSAGAQSSNATGRVEAESGNPTGRTELKVAMRFAAAWPPIARRGQASGHAETKRGIAIGRVGAESASRNWPTRLLTATGLAAPRRKVAK